MPVLIPNLVRKLISRFGITVGPDSLREMGELTPITDLDRLALVPGAENALTSITSATTFIVHTVPGDERWQVQAIMAQADAAGTYTWTICLQRAESPGGQARNFPLGDVVFSADGLIKTFWYAPGLWLHPSDSIIITCSAHTTLSDLLTQVAFEREDCGGGGS